MGGKNISASPLEKENLTLKRIIVLMLQGAIIGAGGILPGVSGGILCVAFGLYMPLMQLFANPLKEIPKTWKKWMFVGIGGCLGLFVFAILLDALFETNESMSKSLFAGLIVGTMPSLFKEAESNPKENQTSLNNKKSSTKYIAMVIGFVLAMTLFVFLAVNKDKSSFSIEPNMFWFCVCGFIIGMGFTIPGLTSSTVLIFLGLLQPMLDGATSLNFKVIIPVGIGVVLSILLLSRIVNYIFDRWYTSAFYAVIGMVVASTIAIIPVDVRGITEIGICIAAALFGLSGALVLAKTLSRYEK